jgi:hypothetical protein
LGNNSTSNFTFSTNALRTRGWHGRCFFSARGWRGYQDSIKKEISIMLWTILVILLVLWLIGLLSNVGGSLIHLLLVVAVVVLIINLVTGRRAV